MSVEKLEEELLVVTQNPQEFEPEAIQAFSQAYGNFVRDATAGAASITSVGVTLGVTAMTAALVGVSVQQDGFTRVPSSITAFWLAVSTGLTASFPGATVITPPAPIDPASFTAVMVSNKVNNASAEEAASTTAAFLAPLALGGTVTFPGPIVSPII